MPPAGWLGRRLPVEWIGCIKCRRGASPVSGVVRRRVLSTINARAVVAQWSYVRPIPQAYVTHSRPLGCTRSSPGHVVWTGSHQAGSGHMSPPDPFLGRVQVFFGLESRDPAVSSPDPTQKGPGPISEVRSPRMGVRRFLCSACILENVPFPGHVATPGQSMWRGCELVSAQPETSPST
jgi:hypothetical protein